MFVFYSLFYMHVLDQTNYVYCSPSVHTSIHQYVNTSDNESYLISPFVGTMKCKRNIRIFWVFLTFQSYQTLLIENWTISLMLYSTLLLYIFLKMSSKYFILFWQKFNMHNMIIYDLFISFNSICVCPKSEAPSAVVVLGYVCHTWIIFVNCFDITQAVRFLSHFSLKTYIADY